MVKKLQTYTARMGTLKFSIFWLSVMFILCILGILVILIPGIFYSFDLSGSKPANIGTTIGGLTSPIIGAITSILLIITLREQQKFNRNQTLKNEVDLYIAMFNMLSQEVEGLHYEYSQFGKKTSLSGVEALNQFIQDLNLATNTETKETLIDHPFSGQILLVVNSFQGIESMLEKNSLNSEFDVWFKTKLSNFFTARLENPFSKLVEILQRKPNLKDGLACVLINFYEQQS